MGLLYFNVFQKFAKRTLCNKTKEPIMKYLCVAEKNDAAKHIAGFLSRGNSTRREGFSVYNKIYEFPCTVRGQQSEITMTSVSGHLLNYAFDSRYKNWESVNPLDLFDAPIYKKCINDMDAIKRTLEREARKCNGLIIWTDCDREGENIGFEIINVCKSVKQNLVVYRAKFSEITAQSIWRALNNLEQPNKNVNDAVDVRQELDLRTGAAFTRLQTLRFRKVFPQHLAENTISYGSCQFPTLGFVVERYQQIESFIPENFWKIIMNHIVKDLKTDFLWKRERLFEKKAVEAMLDICQESNVAKIEDVESKPKSKWRPLPLDTVEMEKTVSKKMRINAKEVMKIAEKLYTQGLISYPRTETNIFPKELNLVPLVEQQREDPNWGIFANRILNEGGPNPRQGRKSDQAHPPIHPTKYTNNLQGNEKRIYEFIVRHFLACVSKDAKGHETIVRADIAGEKFTAKGLMILEKNYLEVYVYERWNAKEINQYQPGDTFTPTELDIVESSTAPPKLLTEADLIALMEKNGIGTDATHAEHIEKIKQREYVGLHENLYFVPQTLGMGLVEGYNNIGLEISLAKPNLRAEFENDLKLICEGRKNAEEVRREQVQKYKEAFQIVVEKIRLIDDTLSTRLNVPPTEYTAEEFLPNQLQTVMKCAQCGCDMILRNRKNANGKFISCTGFPNCKNAIWFSSSIVSVDVEDESCHICGPDYKKLKIKFTQNPFPGEPNPNVLCIGGCDIAVLSALDISLSKVKRSANQTTQRNSAPSANPPPRTNSRTQPTNNNQFNNSNSNANNFDSGFQDYSGSSSNNRTLPSPFINSVSNNSTNRINPLPSTNSSAVNNSTFHDVSVGNNIGDEEVVCSCNKPAVLLTVRKESANKGRKFYKCVDGSNNGGCDFFSWADDNQASTAGNTSVNNGTNNIKCNCSLDAVQKTVLKEGPNKGRKFYCCPKPMSESCRFFQWADEPNDNGGSGGGDGWGGGGGGGGSGRGGTSNWRGKGRGRGRGSKAAGGNRPAPYKTKTRAAAKCGNCGQEGHKRNRCPNN